MTGPELRQARTQRKLSQAKLAELTGIPQHLLSAFELGKIGFGEKRLEKIRDLLEDDGKVLKISQRKKRYQTHEYGVVMKDDGRSGRAAPSKRNSHYVSLVNCLEEGRASARNGRTAMSLFSGAGGFSLGFAWAGFDIKGFVEIDPGLREIYRENFPSSIECGADISEISKEELRKISSQVGKIEVLIGGPPCQGFSLSGKRNVNDPRNSLFRHYLRFVDALRPEVAIMENVRVLTSMANSTGGLVKDDIIREFGALGYKVGFFEVDARDFGVPQHRQRVLFVAVADGIGALPSISGATHGGTGDLFGPKDEVFTFADACSDLEYLESGQRSSTDALHVAVNHPAHVLKWLWDVPEGSSAHDNEEPSLRPPSGYNTTYKRQIWNEPAATVQTTSGMISGCRNVHPIATRSLTIREAARLQSFPDSYKFTGSSGTIRTGIGNAVPPLLAYSLANHVRGRILDLVKVARL